MALPTIAPVNTPAATPTPTAQPPQQRASAGGAANKETVIDVTAASASKVLFMVVSYVSRLEPTAWPPPEINLVSKSEQFRAAFGLQAGVQLAVNARQIRAVVTSPTLCPFMEDSYQHLLLGPGPQSRGFSSGKADRLGAPTRRLKAGRGLDPRTLLRGNGGPLARRDRIVSLRRESDNAHERFATI